MSYDLAVRKHNGLDADLCRTASAVAENINKLPTGAVSVYRYSSNVPAQPELLHKINKLYAVFDDYAVRIYDATEPAKQLMEIDDFMIMGRQCYENGVIVYVGDGDNVEFIVEE